MVTLPARKAFKRDSETDNAIFERVRKEVDLWKVLPPNGEREFDDYYLTNCISPDHNDTQKSMLVYHDGVICRACAFRADTTTLYQMHNPTLTPFQAAERLLAGDYTLDQDAVRVKTIRELDKERSDAMHLELAKRPDAIAALEAMGFEKRSIRHFKLGLASILAPILPAEYELLEGAPNIEWLDRGEERQPYQRQERFAVPVFEGDKLRQVLYRKWHADDLGAKIQMEAKAGTAWLYNVDALQGAEYAVLSEGWGDCIIWRQAGIPAVSGISGAGQFRQDWVEILGQVKRLYVVGDQDEAGLRMMKRVKGYMPWARLVPLPEMERGGDIRDLWLAGWRAPELEGLLKQADQKAVFKALRRKQ